MSQLPRSQFTNLPFRGQISRKLVFVSKAPRLLNLIPRNLCSLLKSTVRSTGKLGTCSFYIKHGQLKGWQNHRSQPGGNTSHLTTRDKSPAVTWALSELPGSAGTKKEREGERGRERPTNSKTWLFVLGGGGDAGLASWLVSFIQKW